MNAAKLSVVKARSGGRNSVSRLLFRKDKTIEALLRLWFQTNAVDASLHEQLLRETLGYDFVDYVSRAEGKS